VAGNTFLAGSVLERGGRKAWQAPIVMQPGARRVGEDAACAESEMRSSGGAVRVSRRRRPRARATSRRERRTG